MKAAPVPINWHSGLPIFASESFLRAAADEYGWLGGLDPLSKLRCVLPYTIVKKHGFRLVRFRVETIPLVDGFGVEEERQFLNCVVEHFRNLGVDIIIPATTNSIFRTYPAGADAAPYGSYIIDLTLPEETLWHNIGRITRQNISTAQKNGVVIRDGIGQLDEAHLLIQETFWRSRLPFMDRESFIRYVQGLGQNGKLMIAEYEGNMQSCALYGFSQHCAYAIYAGNIADQRQGANKLIYWEGIRLFRQLGVRRFDFVGARIAPEKGSKQEAINLFKQRFGATLIQGFMWKYPLRSVRSKAYTFSVRLLRGGDIVDHERHKLTSAAISR